MIVLISDRNVYRILTESDFTWIGGNDLGKTLTPSKAVQPLFKSIFKDADPDPPPKYKHHDQFIQWHVKTPQYRSRRP